MTLGFVSQTEPIRLDASRVLGGFEVGHPLAPGAVPWPLQQVRAPGLEPGGLTRFEAWLADAPVQSGKTAGVVWRRSGGLLFGVVALAEAGASADASTSILRKLSEQAYGAIFQLLDEQGLPHLWRVWNYVPDINGEQAGMERYRQFNIGRGDAFESCARSVTEQVPAACALGATGGPLSIAFLAGADPVQAIENPRQVSAYHYPNAYGPRSPTFSRASLARLPNQAILFISGTASIVGHETWHVGDVVAQAHEAMNNVDALLVEAGRLDKLGTFTVEALSYRVYLRHGKDAEVVQAVMAARVGSAPVHYVQADICRSDLLMEVEAQGLQPC